ncbi:hypothetical protein BYT27DRAFT_7194269 [Phlegmacium glaucopus]|nr:hypothetical protein BYT27DRAFT_7194269 [Phlegmacium glaucopus]
MSFSPPLHIASHSANGSSGNSSSHGYNPTCLRHQEDLINAYEAEEERIINVLSRKLEQLKEDNIQLENTLEAESESHVNRLSRELSALRIAHHQLQQHQQQSQSPQEPSSPSLRYNNVNSAPTGFISPNMSPDNRRGFKSFVSSGRWGMDPGEPSPEMMLEAMRRENEQLRNKLVDTERDYIRISRLNEIYREELIDHRRRLGLAVDNLIGLSSSDPFSQPTHRRSSSASSSGQAYFSNTSSPSTSAFHIPSSSYVPRHALPQSHTSNHPHTHIGVPIPRPPSQIHRPKNNISSESNTPLSYSPSSAPSAESSPLYPFSPVPSSSSSPPSYANPTSFVSVSTNLTTPPSSMSFNSVGLGMGMGYGPTSRGLSYPSVPPPSLSSSFGSPTVSLLHIPNGSGRDASLSPVEPLSRRNSNAGSSVGGGGNNARRGSLDRRIVESGSLRSGSGAGGGSQSRRGSFDRGVPIGGRLAETGTLLMSGRSGRSRAGSQTHGHCVPGSGGPLPETVNEVEDSSLPITETLELGEVSNSSPAFSGTGTGMLDNSDLDIPSTKSR